MSAHRTCANCHEAISSKDKLIEYGDIVYCCEACAFEAGRSKDCSGSTSPHVKPIVKKKEN